ncbi:hypothetical protein HYPSUDRAFT_207337 [Hypholoma sublateritium FD-334 SS-4]|uniref:DUF7918 domain-containing protein n=1 Tax=Hypholoma sublateritium (strain FD-334 SS-4) TaxID=945553 RepID=A0A0D2NHJ3_HYPSF|nr:hypothetical protein HYPSUDRAFT_207337 [Hypholoma sublateritium FD-334 SS-4]
MHPYPKPLPTPHERFTYNGFEVWVSSVDDKALPQYNEEYDELKGEATCWIPSKAGQAFSIWCQKKVSDEYGYRVQIFFDGQRVHKTSCLGSHIPLIQKYYKVRVSDDECRTFVFGSIELTDDDDYLHDGLQTVGEIKIVIDRIKPEATGARLTTSSTRVLPKPSKIHERSKKGLVHQINYGPAIRSKVIPYMHQPTQKYGTAATFIYRYRPLELLQANGIAPRASPVDGPLKIDTKVEVSDGEDAQIPEDILAKERALLAELEQVRIAKRAAIAKDKRPKNRIKSEVTYFTPGEIIDLTL